MGFKAFFGFFVSLVQKAFEAAKANGLTDQIVSRALTLAREALVTYADSAERRDYVVKALTSGPVPVPESIARMAVEAAVQLLKRELATQ